MNKIIIGMTVMLDGMKFTGTNDHEINVWSNDKVIVSPVLEPTSDNKSGIYLQIYNSKSLTRPETAIPGDWILKDSNGEFFLFKGTL